MASKEQVKKHSPAAHKAISEISKHLEAAATEGLFDDDDERDKVLSCSLNHVTELIESIIKMRKLEA